MMVLVFAFSIATLVLVAVAFRLGQSHNGWYAEGYYEGYQNGIHATLAHVNEVWTNHHDREEWLFNDDLGTFELRRKRQPVRLVTPS